MGFNETENKRGMACMHLLQRRMVGPCGNECCTEEVNFLNGLATSSLLRQTLLHLTSTKSL
jgi:hypothetical protein